MMLQEYVLNHLNVYTADSMVLACLERLPVESWFHAWGVVTQYKSAIWSILAAKKCS